MAPTFQRALTTLIAVLTLTSLCAEAQGRWQPGDFGTVRVRLGLFQPDGESTYWQDKFSDWTGSIDDFEDTTFGIDYMWQYNRNVGLLFGAGFYEGQTTQSYRDYVDSNGGMIPHTTTLDTAELTVAWVLRLGRRVGLINPYLGIGAGFVWYNLEEAGAFIDFGDPDLAIVDAVYETDGTTHEYFGLAGLDFAVGPAVTFFAEGRWKKADDDLGDDFAGLGELDLSGLEVSAGFSWRF